VQGKVGAVADTMICDTIIVVLGLFGAIAEPPALINGCEHQDVLT